MPSKTLVGAVTGSALLWGAQMMIGQAIVVSDNGNTSSTAQEIAVPQKPPAPATPAATQVAETAKPAAEPVTSGGSQVRIVRLSLARGVVQMDRNTGLGFETAFANIPVVSGAKLQTGQGVAEVEFEDNSSLRLAPDSEVVFTRLGRTVQGSTETTVAVVKGLVYVSLEKTKAAEFAVTDGTARMVLAPGAHVRVNASGPHAEVAVFDGSTQVEVGSATATLMKKQTVQIDPAAQTLSAVSKGTGDVQWDSWDKQEKDYHSQKSSLALAGGGSGLYGANDLNYYGSYVDMPGCGSMWRPYFASAAWSPFSNGVWTYYPNAGYSWVSPYPWGWLPFHSGSWAQCGSSGWGWRPGGSFYGLQNMTAMGGYPISHPVAPTSTRNMPTMIPVNTKPLSISGASGEAFSFRRDSAGLGVPRAAFGDLHSVSSGMERHGAAVTTLPQAALGGSASAHQTMGPVNAHQTMGAAGTPSARPMSEVSGMSRSSSHAGATASSMQSGVGMSGGARAAGGAAAAGGGHH